MDGEEVLAWLEGVEAGAPLQKPRPPAELVWLLTGLHRHLPRQAWVGEVVRERLGGELEAIAEGGYAGHPDAVPGAGAVPGLEGWRYELHGCGCCLTGPSGVSVDVDFEAGGTSAIDVYFYIGFLRSVVLPEPFEERMLRLFPAIEGVVLAADWLLELGLLVDGTRGNRVRLAAEVEALGGRLVDLASRISEGEAWGPSAAWVERLVSLAHAGGFDGGKAAACASHHLDAEAFGALTAELLRRDVDPTVLAAFEALSRRGELEGSALARLVAGARPTQSHAAARLFVLASEAQLNRVEGGRAEPVLAGLASFAEQRVEGCNGNPQADEIAMVLLEHDPDRARALAVAGRALRGCGPYGRVVIAAVLAQVRTEACHRELQLVLLESEGLEETAAARAALLTFGDAGDVALVTAWENTRAGEPDSDSTGNGGWRRARLRSTDDDGGAAREYVDTPLHNAMVMIDGVADRLRERADAIRRAMASRQV